MEGELVFCAPLSNFLLWQTEERRQKKKLHWCVAESNPLVCTVLFMEKRMWTEGGAAQSAASCVCFLNRNYESFAVRTRMKSCLIYFLFFMRCLFSFFFSMCYFYGFRMMYLLIERE